MYKPKPTIKTLCVAQKKDSKRVTSLNWLGIKDMRANHVPMILPKQYQVNEDFA